MSDVEFIRRLVSAWECCGTCAGGVLVARDRERDAPTMDRLAAAEAAVEAWSKWNLSLHTVHMSYGTRDSLRYRHSEAMRALRDALAAPLTPSEAQDDPECHEKPADDGSKP